MRATHFLNVSTFIEENPEQSGGRESAIETEKLSMKKMISWNVNGLRACLGKGFLEYLKETEADIFCIQESKLQEGQVDLELPGYHQYWNYAEKKGYSGTAMFTKEEPVSVTYGLGIEEHDHEGRVISGILCGHLLYPEFPGRLKAPRLPDAVGGRIPGVLKGTGDEETGNFLR